MSTWTSDQWGAFTGVTVAGLAAVALLVIALRAVRGWTAPAPLRIAPSSAPRPSLVLTERRASFHYDPSMRLDDVIALQDIAAGRHMPVIEPSRQVPIIVGDSPTALPIEHDPMTIDYAADGIGALSSLKAEPEDGSLRTAAELSADTAAWIHEYDAGAAAIVQRFERRALARIDAVIETLLGGLSGADLLDEWRIDTPTREWPIVLPLSAQVRAAAEALLIAT